MITLVTATSGLQRHARENEDGFEVLVFFSGVNPSYSFIAANQVERLPFGTQQFDDAAEQAGILVAQRPARRGRPGVQ